MKGLFVSFLLFFLVLVLVTFLDFLQGLGIGEVLKGFSKLQYKITGEDYFLIFIFFLPLIYSKAYSKLKNQQTS